MHIGGVQSIKQTELCLDTLWREKNIWGSLSLPTRFKPDLGLLRTFGVDLSTSSRCGCRLPSPCVGPGGIEPTLTRCKSSGLTARPAGPIAGKLSVYPSIGFTIFRSQSRRRRALFYSGESFEDREKKLYCPWFLYLKQCYHVKGHVEPCISRRTFNSSFLCHSDKVVLTRLSAIRVEVNGSRELLEDRVIGNSHQTSGHSEDSHSTDNDSIDAPQQLQSKSVTQANMDDQRERVPTRPTHGEGRLQPHPGDVLRSNPNVQSPRSGLNLEGRLSDPRSLNNKPFI